MIELNDNYLIGKGSERLCYRQPHEPDICIKIVHISGPRTLARNQREIKYAKKYNQSNPYLTAIPKFYGTIDTNLGLGLRFQLIKDYDNKISIKLSDYLAMNAADSRLLQKILDLYQTFLGALVLASDLHPGNLLLQKSSAEDYQLIMIDGFGNSDFIKVCDYSRFLFKKKLVRKFKRMLTQIGLPTEEIC